MNSFLEHAKNYHQKQLSSQSSLLWLKEAYWFGNVEDPQAIFLVLPGLNNLPYSFGMFAKWLGKTTRSAVLVPAFSGHSQYHSHSYHPHRHEHWLEETAFWLEFIYELSKQFEKKVFIIGYSMGALLLHMLPQCLSLDYCALAPAFELTWLSHTVRQLNPLLPAWSWQKGTLCLSLANIKNFSQLWKKYQKAPPSHFRCSLILVDPRDEIIQTRFLQNHLHAQLKLIYLNAGQLKIYHFLHWIHQYGDSIVHLRRDILSWCKIVL